MIVKGANIDADDNDGKMPLHEAATAYVAGGQKEKEVAELLIAKGAYINSKNKEGQTPLHIAESKGFKEVADLLRKHGAK